MSTNTPTPQAQPPPMHAADGEPSPGATRPPPLHPLPSRAPSSAAARDSGLASPAGSMRSPRSSLASATSNNSESLTNFMRYGTIRPPVSVLQEEFLEKYRSWREHAEPLDRIDKMSSREKCGDVWTGHMGNIQKLWAKQQRMNQQQSQKFLPSELRQDIDEGEGLVPPSSLLSEPVSSLFPARTEEAGCEQKCEEKVAADDEVDECNEDSCIAANERTSLVGGDDERRYLEKLVSLMFRPGSKLSGTMEIQHNTTRSNYELVVMEGEAVDELGRPMGVLARHKFAGDGQCVYIKLGFVTVEVETTLEEEKVSDDEEGKSEKFDSLSEEEGHDEEGDDEEKEEEEEKGVSSDHELAVSPKKKILTIQMEYRDVDNLIQGLWNQDRFCFEGTVKKLSEGGGEQNQMGGTIISGLISGHSSFNDNDNSRSGGVTLSRRHTPQGDGLRNFSLSPCTHLHPRGVSPAPLWQALSETLSRMLGDPSRTQGDIVISQNKKVNSSKASKPKSLTAKEQRDFLDEMASHDNYKVAMHRSRTDSLRRETLAKLVELGSLVDFAELARKRNVAKRREKWRKRVRRVTPRMPSRPKRKGGRTSASGGAGEFDISKDDVQKKKVQFYDQLAAIKWGDLLEEASVQAERTCAVFRRQTSLLDNLTFESDEFKAQMMSDLRMNGLSLAGSHAQWDQCIQMGRTVALGWSWFERGSWSCFERSAVVGKRCVYLLFQMHSRLETNHKHLEKAFRGADSRLTRVQLERIKSGTRGTGSSEGKGGEDQTESDGLCGICQCDMDGEEGEKEKEDNPAVCLPCSHSFHWACIHEWLHNHSQCPICREDLSGS